jgi:nucleoside 2-deoxyribosyltransferase
MKAYLAIKFHENAANKKLILDISTALKFTGINVTNMHRDYEKWGKVKYSPDKLMKLTFKEIDNSDCLIVEFSEKGVGLGIEAGYAFAKKIPIIVIAKKGSDISSTLKGITKKIIYYKNPSELTKIKLTLQEL